MIEDRKIVKLFFERSEQAIQELDAKYGKAFQKLSYNIVNNRQDAEECVNDTLFTFLEKFNNENLVDGVTVKKENGFEYVIHANDDSSVNAIVECNTPNNKLLVVMEKSDYQETTGLWQVIAYQIIDDETANDMG